MKNCETKIMSNNSYSGQNCVFQHSTGNHKTLLYDLFLFSENINQIVQKQFYPSCSAYLVIRANIYKVTKTNDPVTTE